MLPHRAKAARRRALIGLVGLVGLVSGMTPVEPATAWNTGGGAGAIQFDVKGWLRPFPCTTSGGCDTNFAGTGTGGGSVTALVGGVPHEATFTITSGSVNGWANYSQPGPPLCPVFGDATSLGQVSLSGGATGIIRRTDVLPVTAPGGTITSATYQANFSYTRVGATAWLQFTGGSLTINYHIPATGSGTITQAVVGGEGGALFRTDPLMTTARCQIPGELEYQISGDAGLVMASV